MATKRGKSRKPSDSADVIVSGEFRTTADVRTALILGSTFGIKAVQYSVVEGNAIFEGDIVLGTEQEVAARTEELRQVRAGEVAMGVIRTGAQFRWPNCTVPYTIDPALPNQARVTDAIAHWEANTRFKFVLRTAANAASYPDWVTFRPASGCSSSVGRQGGQQFVNLGSGCTKGNTIHEIGHVVGLWHEQSREDRDSFVTINWSKIQPGTTHNFNQHITDGDDVGAYDYGSIMHYPRNAFSIDGSDTITPVDPTATIGQRTALSAGDIAAANSMCPKPLKEAPFDTRKEIIKDVRLDTSKELIVDTLKEQIKERVKEVAKDIALDPVKQPGSEVILPGRPIVVNPVQPVIGRGAMPFAVATPHHAPAAGAAGGGAAAGDRIVELDAALQGLAEALRQAEAGKMQLQQQYDETAALLKQALDEHEQGSRS
jgi:hypothetical protein